MKKTVIILCLVFLCLLSAVLPACSSTPTSSPIPTLTASASVSSSAPSATTGSQTFGQLADAGAGVFANQCALCHGNNGQGVSAPAVIGSGANLGKYNTAQGLYDFVSNNMPANAPKSLTQQQYQQVVSYLLIQDKFVTADKAFNAGQLSSISLK